MAKQGKRNHNQLRIKMVAKYADKRAALKKAQRVAAYNGDYEAVAEATEKLAKLPKNSSPGRVRNRCAITGRPRGNLRMFGISRITFRELASYGNIPGVTKASW